MTNFEYNGSYILLTTKDFPIDFRICKTGMLFIAYNVSATIPKKGIVSAVMSKKQAGYAVGASRQMAVKSARATGEAVQPVSHEVMDYAP